MWTTDIPKTLHLVQFYQEISSVSSKTIPVQQNPKLLEGQPGVFSCYLTLGFMNPVLKEGVQARGKDEDRTMPLSNTVDWNLVKGTAKEDMA